MTAKPFSILPPLSFIAEVRRLASNAQKRIYLQAMEVEPGEISDYLFEILQRKEANHIDVRLHADYYSLMVTDGVFNYLPLVSSQKRQYRKLRLEKRKTFFKDQESLGVAIHFTNKPGIVSKLFPMFGRNHIKIAIIDDTAFIGGINYHDANFKSNDCMVKLTDPRIVEEIVKVYFDIEEGKLTSDREIKCTETSTLYVDSGKVGKSIILDSAEKIISEAKTSVSIVTPIIPDTKLLKSLDMAKKRNVSIQVIVPEIRKMKGIYKFLDSFNKTSLFIQQKHIPIIYKHKNIHAKMIVVDDEKVLLGSHNLTNRGVLMGTEEIAIVSEEPHFVSQAKAFLNHVLK